MARGKTQPTVAWCPSCSYPDLKFAGLRYETFDEFIEISWECPGCGDTNVANFYTDPDMPLCWHVDISEYPGPLNMRLINKLASLVSHPAWDEYIYKEL